MISVVFDPVGGTLTLGSRSWANMRNSSDTSSLDGIAGLMLEIIDECILSCRITYKSESDSFYTIYKAYYQINRIETSIAAY